jgi:hypothetical protein
MEVGNIAEATADKGNIQTSSTYHLLDIQRTALRCTALPEEAAPNYKWHIVSGFLLRTADIQLLANMAVPSRSASM